MERNGAQVSSLPSASVFTERLACRWASRRRWAHQLPRIPTIPVSNCNVTPDTNQGAVPPPAQITATPITAALLTSGQPCQQVVSTKGLVDGNGLANLQRGFDFYSWLTFIAMNSPADGKTIGQGPRPGGDALARWEDLQNYRPLANVMLSKGDKPAWGTRIVPDQCKKLDGPGKVVFQIGEGFNQPFKSGPLIDQDGNFALFDILMNQPMFDFIVDKGLYSKQGQEKFGDTVIVPIGNNPSGAVAGHMGAIMLKVSYRILDPEKNKYLLDKFHTSDALIYFPGPPATKTGPACVEKKLGLVGFHVGHKTKFAPQWVWTSFEHVSNVPERWRSARHLLPRRFFKAGARRIAPSSTTAAAAMGSPHLPHGDYRSQVIRPNPSDPRPRRGGGSRAFRGILKGIVWENYMLTTRPSDNASRPIRSAHPPNPANTTSKPTAKECLASSMACRQRHHPPRRRPRRISPHPGKSPVTIWDQGSRDQDPEDTVIDFTRRKMLGVAAATAVEPLSAGLSR